MPSRFAVMFQRGLLGDNKREDRVVIPMNISLAELRHADAPASSTEYDLEAVSRHWENPKHYVGDSRRGGRWFHCNDSRMIELPGAPAPNSSSRDGAEPFLVVFEQRPAGRPALAEEWQGQCITALETPDPQTGVTRVWKAFSECGLGPEPKPNRDLRAILEAKIPQENMWWAKAEAKVQADKKKRRLARKADKAASQSPSGSPRGSPSRQSTLDGLFSQMASKAVEDDQHDELALDAEMEQDVMDGDD
eukprot:gene12256-biopygen9441